MGCSKTPEQKIIDHFTKIDKIIVSSDNCAEVADDLEDYFDKNEAKIAKAMEEYVLLDKAEREKNLKKLKDKKIISLNDIATNCKDHPKVDKQMERIGTIIAAVVFKVALEETTKKERLKRAEQ